MVIDSNAVSQEPQEQSRRTWGSFKALNYSLSWFSCPPPRHQVALLRAQLALERKQRQDYIARSVQTSRELAGLHHSLSHSLLAVAQTPEATVLEAETRKLDESLTQSLTSPGPILLCPSPSTTQAISR